MVVSLMSLSIGQSVTIEKDSGLDSFHAGTPATIIGFAAPFVVLQIGNDMRGCLVIDIQPGITEETLSHRTLEVR
jgi:hypothetical protein